MRKLILDHFHPRALSEQLDSLRIEGSKPKKWARPTTTNAWTIRENSYNSRAIQAESPPLKFHEGPVTASSLRDSSHDHPALGCPWIELAKKRILAWRQRSDVNGNTRTPSHDLLSIELITFKFFGHGVFVNDAELHFSVSRDFNFIWRKQVILQLYRKFWRSIGMQTPTQHQGKQYDSAGKSEVHARPAFWA